MIYYWTTQSGTVIPVMEMTNDHLTNAISWLLKKPNSLEVCKALAVLSDEADRRVKYGLAS